ncbi:hypothetical protein J14TS2_38470 [Bacillus sp. J14TS2]|uniref:S8 family serine peptidase n=1 Tax=Bacillus sp. J14TS2 TaxID=2807188 RepID=UPI001B2CEA3F|nr:S8 family serine peptidase [Bacillus sp. J14TS2]GIN73372.1 hypothetical protein J14TS2_38470 [Bacillus sp. J14TS2]
MGKCRLFKEISMILLAVMLLFSNLPFLSSSVLAEEASSNVGENLTKTFEKEEFVTYIVKMEEQVDLQQAKTQGESMAKFSQSTLADEKGVVRNYVVHSLQEVSNNTQQSMKSFLDEKKEESAVQNYHSFYIINAIEVTSNEKVMKEIAKRDDVLSINLNETYTLEKGEIEKARIEKTDEKSKETPWNLNNMNVQESWDLGIEGEGVTVGVIDSGVDLNHPALQDKWRGNDQNTSYSDVKYHWLDVTHENTELPTDGNGHGTHVAGSVLGQEADGSNKIGVAPKASWIAAKVFDTKGETTDSALIRAGEWMLAPGGNTDLAPDIVNNSWSISGAGKNEYLREVIQSWRAANILPVFAAGNTRAGLNEGGPSSVPAPGNYPESFTVGALDEDNELAYFSLLGPSPYDETKPEVSAPGVSIRSAAPDGKYAYMDGTSMASPHVAGLAALILQANPTLNVNELEEVIMETADPLTDSQFPSSPNNGYGRGIVSALNAVSTFTDGLGELAGEVTVEGEDNEAPKISHTPIPLIFNVLDQGVYTKVADNVGVQSVELEVRAEDSSEWVSHEMKLMTGTTVSGEYEGVIPVEQLTVPETEYRIKAIDATGNEVTTEIYTVEVSEGLTKGYTQDFEDNIDGFDFQGDDVWEWGVPSSGPGKAISGEKVMATNLDGVYANGTESMLVLPLLDLRDETDPTVLSFSHWYSLGNWMMALLDTAEVYVGTQPAVGEDFEFTLEKLYDYSQAEWKTDHVDLTPYLGEQVYIIFNLRGIYGSDLGWYLDDLKLTDPEVIKPETPEVSVRSNAPGRVIVEWTKLDHDAIKEYVIYRSTNPYEGFEEIGATEDRRFSEIVEVQKGTYYYQVRARTYAGDLSDPSNTVKWTFTGGEEIYSTDFEDGADEWTTNEGSDWELGIPREGPRNAVSGENVWGTNLRGPYLPDQEHILTSPTIDLTGKEFATIYFQHWFDMDYTIREYGHVEISDDGGETWKELARYPKDGYDSNHPRQFWYLEELNIDEYIGEKVNIRFHLNNSSQSLWGNGWFIDDFEVRETPSVKTGLNEVDAEKKEVEEQEERIENLEAPTWSGTTEAQKLQQMEGKSKVETKLAASTLPIEANLSIIETNRSTKSDAGTGKYSLKHPDGEYTLSVNAYGYKPFEEKVDIQENEVTTKNIQLEPLAKMTVSGTLTNVFTGKPIKNANVKVIEDAKVTPVQTDEKGHYSLELYEGNYHLVASAEGYMSAEVQITSDGTGELTEDIALTPYEAGNNITLFYDDGTAENAVASNGKDAGYAVRMTAEKQSQLLNAQFYFWDKGWPTPGGEEFQYAIYDADGVNGRPGTLLAGPYDAVASLDGSWTEVPILDPLIVEGDFYVVYLQKGISPDVPGLAIDTDGEFADRSWRKEGKRWSKESAGSLRNYMIRSTVREILGEKEVVITDLKITPDSLVLKENEETELNVTGIMLDGKEKIIVPIDQKDITFKSLDNEVATIDEEGTVTAMAPGETEIEVTYKDIVKQVSVQVEEGQEAVDKSELQKKVEEVNALDEADYTTESWEEFASVLEAATSVLDNEKATQAEVDEALAALEAAHKALVLVEEPSDPADKAALQEKVDEVKDIEKSDYTTESWEEFASALEAATSVLDNEEATQAEVDEALAALEAGHKALVPVEEPSDPADKAALQEKVDEVKDLEAADYTTESWEEFTSALEAATSVLDNEEATQAEVDEALAALEAAHKALDPVEEPSDPADKAALQEKVDEVKDIEAADYTTESWEEFASALEAATSVLDNEEATQAEVDEALAALEAAHKALVLIENPEEPGKPDPEDPDPEDPENPDPGKPELPEPVDPDPDYSDDTLYPEKGKTDNKNKVTQTPEKDKTGKKLPNTATNMYNLLGAGALFLVAGITFFLIRRKRKNA